MVWLGAWVECISVVGVAQAPCGLNHVVSVGVVGSELIAGEGVEVVESKVRFGELREVLDLVVHRVVDAGRSGYVIDEVVGA